MATREEVLNALRVADAAGRKDDARALAALYDRNFAATPPPPPPAPVAPKDVGLMGALGAGTASGIRAFGKTAQAVSGGKPEEETEPTYSSNPIKKFAEQTLYGLGRSAPVIAGGVGTSAALGAAGTAVGPEGTLIGAVSGEVLGSAAVSAAQELGPYYAEELKKNPKDPKAAFDVALKRAGAAGGFTGASFGLFRFAPFKKVVADTLLQAFAVQPAVAATGRVAQNVITDRPATEGLKEGYLPSVGGTLVPLVGTHLAGKALRAVKERGRDKTLPPEAPPEPGVVPTAEGAQAPESPAFNEVVARHVAEGRSPEEAAILARSNIAEPVAGGTPDVAEPTGPVGRGDQSGVSDLGGGPAGGPAAAPAEQSTPVGVGRPVDTAAGAGAGEGAVQPSLAETIKGLPLKERTTIVKGVVSDLMPEGIPKAAANKAVNVTTKRLIREPDLDPQTVLQATFAEQGVKVEAPPTIEAAPVEAPKPVEPAPKVELTPETYVDRYVAGEGRGNTPADLEMQQFAENERASISAEFIKRKAAEDAVKVAPTAPVAKEVPEFGAPEQQINEDVAAAEVPATELEAVQYELETLLRLGAKEDASTVQNLRARIAELESGVAPEAPPAEEGPPVTYLPEGTARGVNTKQRGVNTKQRALSPMSKEDVETTEELTQENIEQQKLSKEIGLARNAVEGAITNQQQAALRDMMQPQFGNPNRPEQITRQPLKASEVRAKLQEFKEFQRTSDEAQTPTKYVLQRGENAMPGTGDIRAVYTPEMDAQRAAVGKKLTKRLHKVGLHDIALRVPDMIKERTATGEQSVPGAYYKKIIGVALDSRAHFETLNHEVVHALKALKIFTDAEWKILAKEAEDKWLAKYDIKNRYSKSTPAKQIEEAVAEAFKDYAANKSQQKVGLIKRIFNKIAQFFGATKEVLSPHEEIFRNVERGAVGRRARSPVLDTIRNEPVAFQRAVGDKLEDAEHITNLITRSREATRLNSGLGELAKNFRSVGDSVPLLESVWNRMSIKGKRAFVFTLPTEDVARMAGKSLPGAKRVSAMVENMYRLTHRADMAAAKKIDTWSKFNQKFKGASNLLDEVILRSTLSDLDPFAPRPAKPTPAEQDFYKAWDKLGEIGPSKEGHAIYKEAFDAYRKGLNDTERFTLENITLSELPGSIRDASTPKGELHKEMSDMFAQARKIKNYFPLKRFGEFWYSVGKGKDREFAMFESATARDYALKQRTKEMGGRSLDTMIEDGDVLTGKSMDALEKEITSRPDNVMKKVYDLIDKHGSADSPALKKAVFDAYLNTLFTNDIRKGLLAREGIAGFSTDTLRVFAASQAATARQTAKLLYSRQIKNELSALNDALKKNPNAENLRPLVDTMTARVNRLLDASPLSAWDRAAMLGNKATFFYMLTSPKSAIVNLTQVPIVALPNLAAEFKVSLPKATAALSKNMSADIYNPKSIERRSDLSPEDKAAHKAAYDRADADGLFSNTFVSSMLGKGREPSSHVADSPGAAAWRGATKMVEVMGKLFQESESRSRKLVYMTAFDMALKEAKATGVSMEEAVSKATERARNTTNDSMFNFAEWNKSELQTAGPVGRVATQFTAYQTQVLSYILRNAFDTLKDLKTGERSGAATKLFGTLAMTALFGGVTAMPFYNTTMGLLTGFSQLTRSMLPDDGEDTSDESNPLYAENLDLWFRSHFVPSYFGAGSGMAHTFGLDDKDAALIGQAFLKGPVSAYTGLDFSKSVSIDMPFMNSMANTQSSSARGIIHDIAFNMISGPAGGTFGQMAGAVEDWGNGDTSRAIEKAAPAFLRGGLKAYRMTNEGLLDSSEQEIRSREYFTAGKLLATAIGYGDTEANEAQDMAWAAQKAAVHIEGQRTRVYANIEHALALVDINPSAAADAKVEAAYALADKFSAKYPEVPIVERDLAAAVRGHQRAMDTAIVGYNPPKKYAPFASDILEQYREPEE